MIKAVLFDMDGTLVESWKTTPLPGVPELLQYLRENNVNIGVATNQAGPAWRLATGQEKYPSAEQIANNVLSIAEALQLQDVLWLISVGGDEKLRAVTTDAENMIMQVNLEMRRKLASLKGTVVVSPDLSWRKPKPDMLFFALREWNLHPSEMLYVGDMQSDADAAQNAGVAFMWASSDGFKLLPRMIENSHNTPNSQ